MSIYNDYLDHLQKLLDPAVGAKVSAGSNIEASIIILKHVLKNKGKFAFLYPSSNGNTVNITIRDMNNSASTCVVIKTHVTTEGKIRIHEVNLKYGKCERPKELEAGASLTKLGSLKIDNVMSNELYQAIISGVYDKLPLN